MQIILQQLGFSKNEITVYLALFDLGKCKAGELINYTKLHRNLVYTALDEFVKRELISKTETHGIAVFSPNDPTCLITELEDKKRLAEEVIENLKHKQEAQPREVTVYEGIDGIKKNRERTLHAAQGNTLYVLGASSPSNLPGLDQYWESYHKRRIAKGIDVKSLFERATDPEVLQKRNAQAYTQARYLPFQAKLPVWFEFFGDQLSIGMFGDDPLLFNIKNKEIVDGFTSFFDYLWNQEVTVARGFDALLETFRSMINEVGTEGEYNVLGAFAPVDEIPALDSIFDEVHRYAYKKKYMYECSSIKNFKNE